MRVGVVFPNAEIGTDACAIRDFATAAEELGFAHILAFDHVLGAASDSRKRQLSGPYTVCDPFREPLTLFAFLSAITTRIEFATGVLVLPQRDTALVAKQAAEVAILSDGRLRLGVGVGWNHLEYEALGHRFADRGARQEDQILVLRQLWSRSVIDYSSEFHRLDRVGIEPRPSSIIPVWFGGSTPTAYHRAARLGDGFIFMRKVEESPESAIARQVAAADELRSHLAIADRPIPAFGLDGRTNFSDGYDVFRRHTIALTDHGFSHITINLVDRSAATTPSSLVTRLQHISRELELTRSGVRDER